MKYHLVFKLEQRKNRKGELIIAKVPINAHVTFNAKRVVYFTGYRIDAVNWDYSTHFIKKNYNGYEGTFKVSYSDIKKRLKDIESVLHFKLSESNHITKEEIRLLLSKVCHKFSVPMQQSQVDFYEMYEMYLNDFNSSNDLCELFR